MKRNHERKATIVVVFLCVCIYIIHTYTRPVQKVGSFRSTSTKSEDVWCTSPLSQVSLWAGEPRFRTGIGQSHLKISTRHALAQKWFDQGLNYLHGFWHIEAYRAFQEVVRLDPQAAMGYWGIAMSQPGFAGEDRAEWLAAIEKAQILSLQTTGLERGLIEATKALLQKGVHAALPAFKQLVAQFPYEPEVLAFGYFFMRQAETDIKGEAGTVLKAQFQKALARFPEHVGLMHYYIHLLELRPDFEEGFGVAEKMVRLAPNAPHLVHMPGHLAYLKGDYATAIEVFKAALKQEEAYHLVSKLPFSENQNYTHNLHYLAVTWAEQGDYSQALEIAHRFASLHLPQPKLTANRLLLLYEGRMLPVLVHLRFRQWNAATNHLAQLLQSPDAPPDERFVQTYLLVMQAFSRGMAAVEAGQTVSAKQYLAQMTQWMQAFNEAGWGLEGKMEFQLLNETYDIMEMARLELLGWSENMDRSRPYNPFPFYEALRWEQRIPYDEPPRLMYPMSESLGRLHMKREEWDAARQALSAALRQRPNSPMIKNLLTNLQENKRP